MAVRNDRRREEILKAAYELLAEKGYRMAALSEIAAKSGINKSLLQHYYPAKSDIIKAMFAELLEVSFSYIENTSEKKDDFMQGISDFNMFFFKALEYDYQLKQFMTVSISRPEVLEIWIEIICEWLRKYCGENTFSWLQVRTAIGYSMTGSMYLFLHEDELGIDYRMFCRRHMVSILEMLGYNSGRINEIISSTEVNIMKMDVDDYLSWCRSQICWMAQEDSPEPAL
ncbi:MAG: TetR/AcrR family transcriptional regulator [Solobacterium sp.]|nr:TetR/AcrR family transcriptional regulator [Solobacterium sp.]